MPDPKADITDQSSGSKRRRAPNYTDKEIRILVNLVFEHIDIIENKKTDSETWRVKDLIWNNITESFNGCSGTTSKRTVEMIRQKYDSVKKIARKKEAKNREEPDCVDMEDYEKELIRLLESQGNQVADTIEMRLPQIKTEDNTAPQSQNEEEEEEDIDERFIVTDEDVLWDLPSDMVNRPRLNLIKTQLQHLEREHQYRMKTEELKRELVLGNERRAQELHKRQMELLELEIECKKRALN